MSTDDIERFLELLRQNPELRERVREELALDEVRALPRQVGMFAGAIQELLAAQLRTEQRLDRLTEQVAELAHAQQRTDERIGELADAQRRTDERIGELADAQRRTDGRLEQLTAQVVQLTERLDGLTGRVDRLTERLDGLTERVDRLTERVDRLTAQVEELVEAQWRTDERIAELVEAQRRTDERIAELVEAQRRTDATLRQFMAETEKRFNLIEGRLGNLEGDMYEMKFKPEMRLSGRFRRLRPIALGDIDEMLDLRDRGELSPEEWRQLVALDVLMAARDGRGEQAPTVYLAGEISRVVDADDVRRAAARRDLIRRAGLNALGFVGGRVITVGAHNLAPTLDVLVYVDQDTPIAAI